MDATTFWTMVGSLASLAGATAIGLAVRQLRFDAWLKAQEIFTDEHFVNSRGAVFARFDDSQNPWPEVRGADALRVCRRMDEMAHLAGGVGRDKMLDVWGNPIAKAWLLLKPTVEFERTQSRWDNKWEAFKALGEEAVRRHPKLADLRARLPNLEERRSSPTRS